VLGAPVAQAITFDIGDISGTLNTQMTLGAGIRMEDRAVDLVGKANLDPGVCGGPSAANQSCQGVIKDQTHPGRALALPQCATERPALASHAGGWRACHAAPASVRGG